MHRAAEQEWVARAGACLLGGAYGDMVGGPFDRVAYATMREMNGGEVTGLTDRSDVGDDTQLTLFTLEGLMRANMRWLDRGICHVPGVVWRAYLRWGMTQGLDIRSGPGLPIASGWLGQQEVLHRRRQPSPRCLEVVQRGTMGTRESPPNRSDGSGALMRMAPVGFWWRGEDAVRQASDLAALTHGGPRAAAASAAYAVIVAELMDGTELERAVEQGAHEIRRLSAGTTVGEALQRAMSWAATRDDEPAALAGLGTGQTSLSALLHAVFAVLRASSLVEAVRVAVNQDGTSATSGHLAGQLAGLVHGSGELEPMLDRIPVATLVEKMLVDAERIRSSSSFGFGEEDASDLWEQYPGF